MSPRRNEQSSADYTPADPSHEKSMADVIGYPANPPKSELARYRLLSPSAAVRVSPICLGGMSLGEQWSGWMGGKSLNQAQSEELLDAYHEAGGNFIDVSNNYQDEQSEHILGEWMEKRGNRDEIVLASKYSTFPFHRKEGNYSGVGVNWAGNHRKSLHLSLERSLRKLRTDYVDILYVHWWDHSTSIPELMQSLNDVVRSGKVLYLGVSDTPAWVVSQANEYARREGMAQFVVYQGMWNLSARDIERDVLPMCRHNGMSLVPWGVLGQGRFKSPEELKSRSRVRGGGPPDEAELKLCKVLQEVADEIGGKYSLANVAMAWTRGIMTDCYPVLGGASVEHLKENIEALKIKLTDAQMKRLSEASPFVPGFPTSGFGQDPRALEGGLPDSALLNSSGHVQFNTWT